jgi:hypothetical protein
MPSLRLVSIKIAALLAAAVSSFAQTAIVPDDATVDSGAISMVAGATAERKPFADDGGGRLLGLTGLLIWRLRSWAPPRSSGIC